MVGYTNEQLLALTKDFNEKVLETLNWITSPHNSHLIRWDLISNSEVHILHKLAVSLKTLLQDHEGNKILI